MRHPGLLLLGALGGFVSAPPGAFAECIPPPPGRTTLLEVEVHGCSDVMDALIERMKQSRCEGFSGREIEVRADDPDLARILREGQFPGYFNPPDLGPRFLLDATVTDAVVMDTLPELSWSPARPLEAGERLVVASCEHLGPDTRAVFETVPYCSCIGCDLDVRARVGPEVRLASPEVARVWRDARHTGLAAPMGLSDSSKLNRALAQSGGL